MFSSFLVEAPNKCQWFVKQLLLLPGAFKSKSQPFGFQSFVLLQLKIQRQLSLHFNDSWISSSMFFFIFQPRLQSAFSTTASGKPVYKFLSNFFDTLHASRKEYAYSDHHLRACWTLSSGYSNSRCFLNKEHLDELTNQGSNSIKNLYFSSLSIFASL